tara:strand:+ start:440 stop:946 length:507 start_codon:yes stop_codon:yes gene_type:complete
MAPLFEIIDVEILLCWHDESLEYWLSDDQSLQEMRYGKRHRSNIFTLVKNKIEFGSTKFDANLENISLDDGLITWAKLYPEWFDRSDWDPLGVRKTIDHRIQALINRGFIEKVPRVMMGHSRDMFQMDLSEITISEWELLKDISNLEPKIDVVVPKLTQFKEVLRVNN